MLQAPPPLRFEAASHQKGTGRGPSRLGKPGSERPRNAADPFFVQSFSLSLRSYRWSRCQSWMRKTFEGQVGSMSLSGNARRKLQATAPFSSLPSSPSFLLHPSRFGAGSAASECHTDKPAHLASLLCLGLLFWGSCSVFPGKDRAMEASTTLQAMAWFRIAHGRHLKAIPIFYD